MNEMMREYYKLFRFDHALLAALGVFVGQILSTRKIMPTDLWVVSWLATIFIEMGTFSLNDYLDYKSDLKNKRKDRPLVSGLIKLKNAFNLGALFLFLGIFTSWFLGYAAFLFILTIAAGNIAYNTKLKRLPLVGNVWVSIATASTFLFGAVVTGTITNAVIYLSILAFFASVGREISKTIMDVEGDATTGAITLPMVVGINKSAVVSAAFFTIAFIFAFFVPFIQGDMKFVALMFPSGVTALRCAVRIYKSQDKKTLEFCRSKSMQAFIFGLFGAVLYVLI